MEEELNNNELRGKYNIILKELIKEVEDEFKKQQLIKQLNLKEYTEDGEYLTTGTVVCRSDDDETVGHYLAYGTGDEADSVKMDKLAL